MLGLASTIVVARVLLPDELGIFAIATTISGALWMLGGGQGMAGALIRRSDPPTKGDLRVYVGLQLAIMSVLAVGVALAALPFGRVGQVTAVMVAVAPITAFRGAGIVVIERQLLYRKLATAETSELFVYYAWTVGTVLLGLGVWGLATATVIRSLVGTVMIVWLAPTPFLWPRFERARSRALLGMGVRIQAVELLSRSATRSWSPLRLLSAGSLSLRTTTSSSGCCRYRACSSSRFFGSRSRRRLRCMPRAAT